MAAHGGKVIQLHLGLTIGDRLVLPDTMGERAEFDIERVDGAVDVGALVIEPGSTTWWTR